MFWKVGDLARETGLTVRTLHHYDEIGLLSPSHRTESGHRLYTERDIARLQQIKSLRALGFSLEEIGALLRSPEFSPSRIVRLHLERARRQVELQQQLCARLEALDELLASTETVSVEHFIRTIEVTTMMEKYFTPQQLDQLAENRKRVGDERITTEWPQLVSAVRAEMENGTPPENERVQGLVRQWGELANEISGGDPELVAALRRLVQDSGAPAAGTHLLDPQLLEYVGRARACSNPA
jgi:DNA-binding transcriptional MerR regulator